MEGSARRLHYWMHLNDKKLGLRVNQNKVSYSGRKDLLEMTTQVDRITRFDLQSDLQKQQRCNLLLNNDVDFRLQENVYGKFN